MQETFVRAFASLRSIPEGTPREEAWLVRVLVNIRRDQWRRAAVAQRSAPLLTANTTALSGVEAGLIVKRAVSDAVNALPPRRRAIVVMAELDGLAPAAIATTLGVRVMTVRWHLAMARRELKQTLAHLIGDTTWRR